MPIPNISPAGWQHRDPLFLDFEACSTIGWPIEVGWAGIEAGRIVVGCLLIRPEPDWDEGEWDALAEEVYGIPLDGLRREGVPAPVVADRLAAILRVRTVISDAAPCDRAFLDRLVDLHTDWPDHSLIDLEEAVRWLDEPARARLRASLNGDPAPHRAGEDAARLARAWLTACAG